MLLTCKLGHWYKRREQGPAVGGELVVRAVLVELGEHFKPTPVRIARSASASVAVVSVSGLDPLTASTAAPL
ncbi:MAG: hypothetical protein ACRDSZ_24345 [Pseudonocardiaceae bacterium]